MKALTFNQWKAAGYHVRKGQRSHTSNKAGEPTFTRDQVEETKAFDYADLRQWKDGEERDFTDAMDSLR